jgi:nucleoside-diphosphate-sugar epimerase
MAFQQPDIVLVTGGNGHVAQHMIEQLLAIPSGPTVRTTVRSGSSAEQLKSFFKLGALSKKLEVLLVSDITLEGAFNEALQGVTHIAHIASPFIIGAKDIENDLLIPAINGTTGILKSALQSKTLKAVVATSSFVSVFDSAHGFRPGYTYSPDEWNPITYEEVIDPNLDLKRWPETWRPFVTYAASKKLAEKAAWDLWKDAKPQWDLSFVLPTYIGGPSVLPTKGEDHLTYSNGILWGVVSGKPLPMMDWPFWVDVRDVAKAHIEALQTREASGKRFILTGTKGVTYSDVSNCHYISQFLIVQLMALDCGHWAQELSISEPFGRKTKGKH